MSSYPLLLWAMHRKRLWSIMVLGVLLSSSTFAQNPWTLSAGVHYGFLWPHRPKSWVLVTGHTTAVEVFAEKQVSGKQQWHHTYIAPYFGVGLLYTDMADPERVGAALRLLPYLHLPLVRGGRSCFGMRLGWGIGYMAKPYDRVENTQQIAIGSRINAAIQIMSEYKVHIGRTTFSTGIAIDHWSNGSYRLPNLGVNMLSARFAVGHALSANKPVLQAPDTSVRAGRKREQSVVVGLGVNETSRPYRGQHVAYSVIGQVVWRLTERTGVALGMDVFNKGAIEDHDAQREGISRLRFTQFGLHGGYTLLLGPGEVFLQMGGYVYTPFPDASPFFHRLGVRYRCGRHVILNMSLKSHYAIADHWEFGLGYRWN